MFAPGNWAGFNWSAVVQENIDKAEKIREERKAEEAAPGPKCELCGRLEQEVWCMNGPFPYNLCVDIDGCDQYRKSISRPLMEM